MSTEPDAPPSDDDATRQGDADATSDNRWKNDPYGAHSERILVAAFRYRIHADPPLLPPPPPIHPDVRIDDMRNANDLLCNVIIALRDGDRESLDRLKYAVDGIAIALNDAPNPAINADDKKFYLWRFVHLLAGYYHFPENDDLNRLDWFKGWGAHFAEYDTRFANLDDAFVEKECKEINFEPTGSGAKGWIKAAATIAVSVGAFDSLVPGKTKKQCIDRLDNSLGKLWSTRDKERFSEPELPQKTVTRR